jgi:hypothetical protein
VTVVEMQRPAAPAPVHRTWDVWLDVAIRFGLMAILLAAWVSVVPAATATQRSSAQLLGDLKAGNVHSLQYRNALHEVRWTDGGLLWYRVDIAGVGVAGLAPTNGASTSDGSSGSPLDDDYRAWMSRALSTSTRHVSYQEIDSSQGMSWIGEVPWRGLSLAAGLATIAAFFLMLGRDRRRFGNRWAWFWVFVLVGNGVGPFLFLLLEPRPLWERGPVRSFAQDAAYTGGLGLVVAICLKIALVFAARLALAQFG